MLSVQEKMLDVLAFPDLFPRGRYGMYTERVTRVSPTVYIHNRFLSGDRRFAQHTAFLFHIANYQDMKALADSVVFQLKKATTRQGQEHVLQIVAGGLLTGILEGDAQLDSHLSSFFPNVRGHRDYWHTRSMEIQAQCEYV